MTSETAKSTKTWNKTALTDCLGIDYPLIQGPLGGLLSQRLAALVSNFGGLGSFGAHGFSPEVIKDIIAEIRSLTDKPFAMNLWVSMEDEGAFTSDEAAFKRSLAPLAVHIKSLGGQLITYKAYTPNDFEAQVRVLLDEKVPVFSFICGIPAKEILDECRIKGIKTMGAATTPEEAVALEQAGVDVIVASGFEAGGHRGSFLQSAEESLMGTFSLIPQVADRVKLPLVAAGGIADARGIKAAFALGADGVQMGTVFLPTEESGANPYYRATLLSSKPHLTALTRGFTGRLARGLSNQLLEELNRPGIEILPYPLQRGLVRNLTALAEKAGRTEFMQMWAGQSVNLITCKDAKTLLRNLLSELSTL